MVGRRRRGSPQRTYALDRDAAIRRIDAARQANASQFVMVSYFGAGPDLGVDPSSDFFAYAESKTEADAHVAASSLGWTILRPSRLTEEAGTGIETGAGVTGGQVARATLADVITAVFGPPTRRRARHWSSTTANSRSATSSPAEDPLQAGPGSCAPG